VIKVVAVKPRPDFSLDLRFDDGSLRRFDVKPYLDLGVFTELKDLAYFMRVTIAYGTVHWPHEQDISPDTLYLESHPIDDSNNEKSAISNP
jgi:hypothetical protein